MRIAQLFIAPVARAGLREVEALPDSAAGAGGFGSTGASRSRRLRPQKSRQFFRGFLAIPVHDLDFFGASPRGCKVVPIRGRRGGRRSVPGARLNAGDDPGAERAAAFSSEARWIPRRDAVLALRRPVPAQPPSPHRRLDASLAALAQHDPAGHRALALTLGLLCFAVVTAIMLVRTRARAAQRKAAAREEIDRAARRLRATQDPAAVGAATADRLGGDRRRAGDHRRCRPAVPGAPQRGCLPSAAGWSRASRELWRRRSTNCAPHGRGFLMTLHSARRRADRGGRPRHRRPRRAAAARGQRHQGRPRRARHALPAPVRHRRHPARPGRCAAGAGLDARCRRPAHLRQQRLCARGRGEGRQRGGREQHRAIRPRGAARARARRAPPGAASPAGCRRSPPDTAHFRRRRRAEPRGSAGIADRRHRSGGDAQRAQPHERRAPPHARPARHRRRHVRRRPQASFYNAAYRALWELDGGFLDQAPTDSAVLDRLRDGEQAARAAALPALESAAARGLSRQRAEGADVAPARRPHRCASSSCPIRTAA